MANLWQFFGLPDPDGNPPSNRRPPSTSTPDQPVTLDQTPTETSVATTVIDETVTIASPVIIGEVRSPPLGWCGPITPDGEPFHDLGVIRKRPAPPPSKALRYIAPDEMKRIPTEAMFKRVLQGDTAIVDLRPLVHMESHQMACRRELKHAADQARVSVFAMDAEDKLLMVPGLNVVVDMEKHHLGLRALI
jgi:hypothetical protein